jgi:hypothetical protein
MIKEFGLQNYTIMSGESESANKLFLSAPVSTTHNKSSTNDLRNE